HDLVALAQAGAVGVGEQIDAERGAGGEDHLVGIGDTQIAGDRPPRLGERLGRGLGERIDAALDVGAVLRLEREQGVGRGAADLAGRGVVQVVEAARAVLEHRELGAHHARIEAHASVPTSAASASGVSTSSSAASSSSSISNTASAWAPSRWRAPTSPAMSRISGTKLVANRTGLPRLPRTVGTMMARPSVGSNALISRFSWSNRISGMSPSSTSTPSASSGSAASPARSEVLSPSA